MPNGIGDDAPVSWGRFTATVTALEDRLAGLEGAARERVGLVTRVDGLRRDMDHLTNSFGRRRDRTWTIACLVLTGLVMPTVITLLGIWLHIRIH